MCAYQTTDGVRRRDKGHKANAERGGGLQHRKTCPIIVRLKIEKFARVRGIFETKGILENGLPCTYPSISSSLSKFSILSNRAIWSRIHAWQSNYFHDYFDLIWRKFFHVCWFCWSEVFISSIACATLCISGKPFSNGLNTGNMQKNISQYQLDIAAYLLEKLMALCNRLWRISGLMTD